MTINKLKSLLSRFYIRPNKLLGQNFLLSEKVLDQIVAAGELTRDDIVLEIGPGLGFLTKRLAEKAGKVVAVEKDRKLCRILAKLLKRYNNVNIVCGDAMYIKTEELINGRTKEHSKSLSSLVHSSLRYKVIANIPYYLTGKILQKFLIEPNKPVLIIFLLQKEVAERIVAEPGKMSILSVSVQFYADPEIVAYVPKENFYPMPEVDSAVVKIRPHTTTQFGVGVDEKKFFQLVQVGFSNKRKQLKNNLTVLTKELKNRRTNERKNQRTQAQGREFRSSSVHEFISYRELLLSIDLNPQCRAQDLSLEDWVALYKNIYLTK